MSECAHALGSSSGSNPIHSLPEADLFQGRSAAARTTRLEARVSLCGQPGSESFRGCTDSDAHRHTSAAVAPPYPQCRRRIRRRPQCRRRIRGSFKLAPAVVTETWTESFAPSLLVRDLQVQVLILEQPVGVNEDQVTETQRQ
jgi:hypothetical protein